MIDNIRYFCYILTEEKGKANTSKEIHMT